MGIECSMGSESLFKGHGAKERCIGEYGFLGGQRWVIASEKSADQVPQPEGCYALRCLLQGTTVSTQSGFRCLLPMTSFYPFFPLNTFPVNYFALFALQGSGEGGTAEELFVEPIHLAKASNLTFLIMAKWGYKNGHRDILIRLDSEKMIQFL